MTAEAILGQDGADIVVIVAGPGGRGHKDQGQGDEPGEQEVHGGLSLKVSASVDRERRARDQEAGRSATEPMVGSNISLNERGVAGKRTLSFYTIVRNAGGRPDWVLR